MKAELRNQIRSMPKDDAKIVKKMYHYFVARFLNPICRDELIEDIIGMAKESEQRKVPFAQTVGMDYQLFCHELAANIPRQRTWEIAWSILWWIFAAFSIAVPMIWFYSLLFPQWSAVKCEYLTVTVPLCWVIRYAFVISALVVVYYLLRRFSYANSVLLFGICSVSFIALFLIADFAAQYFLDGVIVSLNILIAFAILIALSMICYSMRYFASLIIAYKLKKDVRQ